MGVDSRRPPLPAPTESMGETSGAETEVATNLTTRTDKTSYEIPEDGSPITISTQKITASREGSRPGHHRQKSQTSLLIEYFEAGKRGDKVSSRPSVRVKVTPSARKSSRNGGHDAIQFTAIGKDRKSSYTRRISLNGSKNAEVGLVPTEGTEISQSSGSNISSRPPVEIEVQHFDGSDISGTKSRRGLSYAVADSNVSSMPPDSMLEGSNITGSELSHDLSQSENHTVTENEYLKAPVRSRSRSTSRDRITQKVMEKLGATTGKPRKSSTSKSGRDRSMSKEYDADGYPKERRRRSSKSHHLEEESTVSGAESSMLSSRLAPSERSYRSGTTQGSRMTNNPRLLEMVEDTIKRMILPEINAIKEDQRTDRNLRTFDGRRGSLPRDGYETPELERRVSKSSSSPHMTSKPKVILNREGEEPVVLSRGDSERKKTRKSSREHTDRPLSSRRSSGRSSIQGDEYDQEGNVHRKSSKSGHGLRDAAVGAIAGGVLTTAALKHHDSASDVHDRRKNRSKSHGSRSRSTSITETNEDTYGRKEEIPPMPMASHINDSDMTRDSIVSAATEEPNSRDIMTPVREVQRSSVGDAMSPAHTPARTPTRTPVAGSPGLGMTHANYSIGASSPISARARAAGLAAAGVTGLAAAEEYEHHHVDADGYGELSNRRGVGSPAHSVSSLKNQFEKENSLIPSGLRPKSAASRSSAGHLRDGQTSRTSARSSPTTQRLAQSRKHSQDVSGDEFITPFETPGALFAREGTPGTPTNGESVDEWYERQHSINDRYRDSIDHATNRDSYQTNPYPDDDKRYSKYTEDSFGARTSDDMDVEQNVKHAGAQPIYQTPAGVESNVASLMEPSIMSSNMLSSLDGSSKNRSSYADRMADQLRELGKDSPAMYDGSTLSETMPSQDRWAAIKGHARNLSSANSQDQDSLRSSPEKSIRVHRSIEQPPIMSASGLPVANDPLPEIGHFDDTKSEVSTNPSIVKGPLGGDPTGRSEWPYDSKHTPVLRSDIDNASFGSSQGGHAGRDGLMAAAAGGAATLAATHAMKKSSADEHHYERRELTSDLRHGGAEIDREATPTGSPAGFRDEGYVTDAHARSAGNRTPRAGDEQRYSKEDLNEFNRAMDAQSLGEDDPFTSMDDGRHARHVSGNSHGMASPLYDSSTGKGKIESKDIVALMDHLTVRDAQRNARDTEILVSLVRSAAEMRSSFDEMKQFIKEQDRLIMANTDRDAEQVVARVIGGPRPLPLGSPRAPRGPTQEDVQAKRKGVLRRALKGLTGGKKADDLARVEDMLMQILDNVEDLKHGAAPTSRQQSGSYTETMDSYEKLRAAPDSGYEPEGQADTSSTPSQSGHFTTTPRGGKEQFHSGYDGRRGSINRVSTVMEGDEDQDELTPEEARVLRNQFENNERLLTPTQESHLQRNRGLSPNDTPYHGAESYTGLQAQEITPKRAEKERKHKSNSSSIFGGVPKVSRWSKTTSSSAAPDLAALDSPIVTRGARPVSAASRSTSTLDEYDDDKYDRRSGDSRRSVQSLGRDHERPHSQAETKSMRSGVSKISRTPSPLIPSVRSFKHDDHEHTREASPDQEDLDDQDDYGFDDPKYQAHRNSILLQHPQPRQGPTGRHQNHLETKAEDFDDPAGTNSDLSQRTVSDFDPATWGSSGTAALSRNRFSQTSEPLSPASMGRKGNREIDAPLIPQQQQQRPAASTPTKKTFEEPAEQDWEPSYSNSGFSRGGYYTSPYGSGHLLEPIEEVRYSLETDSGHISPEPQLAKAVDMRSKGKKITGPRPMGARSPQPAARVVENGNGGTIRRKPVAQSIASDDSLGSDTF
ncbi:hypothetical protein LTR62_006727 [Meristemomyces frigidus]|uniref:Uncharacterized protein n=1 Tax=Meristemomyces frigidus TaxID=1508187 RepID=A0AAN7TQD0_9PEZI|nr:hypothetical protein LTR62_006727 [Meristemomyces frigidus]